MIHSRFSLPLVGALATGLAIAGSLAAQTGVPSQPTPANRPAKPDERGDADGAKAAKWLLGAFGDQPQTEAAEMLIAIAKGSNMGPGDGWFHAGQARRGWKWLAERHALTPDTSISRAKFQGPEPLFTRLDRNKDGVLRADDFDWSDRSFHAQQAGMILRVFRRLNSAADGRLTREQWDKFFEEAAKGKDHLTFDNLREHLVAGSQGRMSPSDIPTPQVLVRGLFRGEIGSMHEGPRLDDSAPDFSLKSRDGKSTYRLSDRLGKKPIVLMFGNFTCGPFRGTYPRVEELAQRYKGDAEFVGVYVREAHPTDGWHMSSNDDEVKLAQPRDYAERTSVANRCGAALKMSIPLLVDEMDDRVGHAYSGMPARLYVIDRAGKIAYKSGRGPFGFKPDEMEQALVLLLLEETADTAGTLKSTLQDK